MTSIAPTNRLANSLSPYLRQHADNPVNWQPWDDIALELAQTNKVPILLSIGYSACHWCHVMENESFTDPAIAQLMNADFVCIKVDREERPDLDKTYQLAHYLLSRTTGGWPLTLFLSPDQKPFFSGTYFPVVARGSLPSFTEVLQRVRTAWYERPDAIKEQNEIILQAMTKIDISQGSGKVPDLDVVHKCLDQLQTGFDMEYGGLGKAPKFPQVPALRFACQSVASGNAELAAGLTTTLDAMAKGGLHDQIGGGFFRYCVDPVWDIPHFEKMLTDNALLLALYASAAVILKLPAYAIVAERTANWMLEQMGCSDGGFASAMDADSEGEEGRYYVWSKEELVRELKVHELESLIGYTNLGDQPNFEGGTYHLHQPTQASFRIPTEQEQEVLVRLLNLRSQRPKPATDDKVLVSNCGLAADALAHTGLVLGKPQWVTAARQTLTFVEDNMRVAGVYRTVWRDGKLSDIPAFLDDYAYLLRARLTVLQDGTALKDDLQIAADLADRLVSAFDDGGGGLLFVAKEAPQTIRKIRSCDDGATPAGNAVAAESLLRLGWLLGRDDYLALAERILVAFEEVLVQAPVHSPSLVLALQTWHEPPAVVTITGSETGVSRWHDILVSESVRGHIIIPLPSGTDVPAPLVKPNPPEGQEVGAFICTGTTCTSMITDLETVRTSLLRT